MSSSQLSLLPNATRELAGFAAKTGSADIPSEVRTGGRFSPAPPVCLRSGFTEFDEGGQPDPQTRRDDFADLADMLVLKYRR
jgi:hypothetical protein